MRLPEFDCDVLGASYIGAPREKTFMFVTKKVEHLLQQLYATRDCLVFAQTGMDIPAELKQLHRFVVCDNPQQQYANTAWLFAKERDAREQAMMYVQTPSGYYIAPDAVLGKNVIVEPGCVIGHGVTVGDNTTVLSGAVLKHCTVGENVIINEKAVVGANGFTMAEDEQGNKLRIPTLGKVVIGNYVEIGAHDNISCGSGGDTCIEDYVKIDAHVHIGHDVHLHKNVEITAGAIIGGFVTAKERAYVGINAVVRNRVTLGESAFVGMGAVVTKSVEDRVTVVGNPAKPFVRQ